MNESSNNSFLRDGKTGFEKAKIIGLIDNELCTRSNHSFPNLAVMKLSTYYKLKGCSVRLITFDEINPNTLFATAFDAVFVSKVFSDTETPTFIDELSFVHKGGSGFYYDKATPLHEDIEHSFPDYNLYDSYPSCNHSYYKDYSIGFLTRGCVRQCSFCINKNSTKVEYHSEIGEFYDKERPYIMLLDDNITAYKDFYRVFDDLNKLNVPFVFKQGMDFRILTPKKMQTLWYSNYKMADKNNKIKTSRVFHFAFDNIKDFNLIERKLKEYYYNKPYSFKVMFYVLVGYDRDGLYDDDFYLKDIKDMLKRIELLFKYSAYPYIMRHENYVNSPYSFIYKELSSLINAQIKLGSNMNDGLIKNNSIKTYNWLKDNESWFLSCKLNTKMPVKALKGEEKKLLLRSNSTTFD